MPCLRNRRTSCEQTDVTESRDFGPQQRRLVHTGIVSLLCKQLQGWHTLWRKQLHSDLVPFAVMLIAVRTVAKHVLIAQFHRDLAGGIWQVLGVVNRETPPARDLADVRKQVRSKPRFFGTKIPVIDSEGVDRRIALPNQSLYILLRVAAVIVSSVRDYEQRFPWPLRTLHLRHPQIDGIQQRRRSLGVCEHQIVLNLIGRPREVNELSRCVGERDHKKFV